MSMDDRLRSGLQAGAADIEPDVERHLSIVTRRSRDRSTIVPATAMALVAVVAAISMVLFYLPDEASEPATPQDPADVLVGTYRVRLDESQQMSEPTLLGEWELEFDAHSGITVTAPASFVPASGVSLSGYAYALRGDSVTTNLLTRELGYDCAGPGSYRWHKTGSGLAFETIDDTCRERVAILTSGAWTKVGG
jgi:hypothetical protein